MGSNIVHRKTLKPDGVGMIADRADKGREFVASTDNWFRPAQFSNGPDGNLYIIDVYREVIEHPLSLPPEIKQHFDLTSGRDRGRIYRVVPDGYRQKPVPRLSKASTADLVAALASTNGWTRDTAARLLYERQDKAAIKPLEKLAAEASLPQARMQALYALAALDALAPDVVLARLADEHPRVREHAVRLAETLAGDSAPLRAKLLAMTDDPDLRVRYQLAFSLGEIDDPARDAALAAILKHDAQDKWVRLAVFSSLASGAGEVFAQLAADNEWRATATGRQLMYELARYIGRQNHREEIARVLPVLESLSPADISLSSAIVRGLGEGLSKGSGTLRSQLAAIGSDKAAQILDKMLVAARTTAVDDARSPVDRVDAIRLLALGSFADAGELLAGLVSNRQPQDVQSAAIVTLGKFDDPSIAAALLGAWPSLSPRLRAEATEVLFARADRLQALLAAAEAGDVSLADLDAARLQTLAKHPQEAIRRRAEPLLAKIKLARGRKWSRPIARRSRRMEICRAAGRCSKKCVPRAIDWTASATKSAPAWPRFAIVGPRRFWSTCWIRIAR